MSENFNVSRIKRNEKKKKEKSSAPNEFLLLCQKRKTKMHSLIAIQYFDEQNSKK